MIEGGALDVSQLHKLDYFHCTESSDHNRFRNLTFVPTPYRESNTHFSLVRMRNTRKGRYLRSWRFQYYILERTIIAALYGECRALLETQ